MMEGFQRGKKPKDAGHLGDVPVDGNRHWAVSQRKVHLSRQEGGSLCIRGRKSYFITDDLSLVTCTVCIELNMSKDEKPCPKS